MSPVDPARGEPARGRTRRAGEPGAGESATAQWYRHFGTVDAPGNSDCYAEWSVGIAEDPELLRRIDEWPHNKRQPLLMLAAARFLGAQISPYRGLPGVPGRALGGRLADRAHPRHPDQRGRALRHPAAVPGADRRRRRAPAGAHRGRAPRPGWPCSRTATATSTTPAPGSRGWPRPAPRPAVTRSWAAPSPGRSRCRRSSRRWCGGRGSTSTPSTSGTPTTSPGWRR